jgi:hypothetical protein
LEAIVDDEKSIVEKFTDAVKGVVDSASTAAMQAMATEPLKPDEEVVVIPALEPGGADLIAPVPPMIAVVKKKRRRASKGVAKAAKASKKKTAKKSAARAVTAPKKTSKKTVVKKSV